MAELNASCCSSDDQAACCAPDGKAECCDPAAHTEGACGCAASGSGDIREAVRDRYAAAARRVGASAASRQH